MTNNNKLTGANDNSGTFHPLSDSTDAAVKEKEKRKEKIRKTAIIIIIIAKPRMCAKGHSRIGLQKLWFFILKSGNLSSQYQKFVEAV